MRKSVLRLASSFIAGMLWTATPACFADDTASAAPVPSTGAPDWFRQPPAPGAGGPSVVPGTSPYYAPTPAPQPSNQPGPIFASSAESPYAGDYPSRDLSNWVFANAHAATARALFSRAENDLAASYQRAQHHFERSKAFVQASTEEKDAYEGYLAARQKAMRELNEDPKYQQLLKLRDELTDKIAIKRGNKEISKDEILAMATLKMEYASDARSMESIVLSNDTELADARKRMIAASQKTVQMRADFDDSLADNPQILAARENLADARIGLITSQAYLSGSSVVSSAALDYAYYLHRNDVGRYDPYANGYGSAYSPYWVRN
jgi:hypothetical protein